MNKTFDEFKDRKMHFSARHEQLLNVELFSRFDQRLIPILSRTHIVLLKVFNGIVLSPMKHWVCFRFMVIKIN